MRARRWGFRLGAVLLGAALPVFAMEGYLRFAGIGGGFYMADPVLGSRLVPNGTGRWRKACFDVPIKINSHGFRDVEHQMDKPQGVERIIVLGDSIAEALQVPLATSFPRRLEAILNGRGVGPPVEVFNFGVAGYGTAQQYLSLKTRAPQYRPDTVVLVFTISNDVRNNSPTLEGRLSDYPRPFFRLGPEGGLVLLPFEPRLPDTAGVVGKIKTVLRNLRLYHILVAWAQGRPAVRSLFAKLGLLPERGGAPQPRAASPGQEVDAAYLDFEVYRREPHRDWAEAWQVTERLIRAVRDETRRTGARLLLVSAPGSVELASDQEVRKAFPHYVPDAYDFAGPRERLRRLAAEEGIEHISLYEVFRDDLRTRGGKVTDIFWWCDGHLAPHGHHVVAQAIADRLHRVGSAAPPQPAGLAR